MEIINYFFYCVALFFSMAFGGNSSGSWLDFFVGAVCLVFLGCLLIAVIVLIKWIVSKVKKKKAALNKENKKDFIN